MKTILIERATVLVTMDPQRREIPDGSVLVVDNVISKVDTSANIRAWIAQDPALRTPQSVIDARGCVVLPGFVNGHHHMFQTLTRTMGTGQGRGLFDWLKLLYPVWACLDPEAIQVSSSLALCELVLSGATTVADHLYLFPNGIRLEDEIMSAAKLGVRFHPTRGSMSLGQSKGGLPPDSVVEKESDILRDCQDVITRFHDPRDYSMVRVGVAPCSPFSVTADLMRDSALLARSYEKVGLHTHLAETLDEHRFCMQSVGKSPMAYAESLGWLGDDVWFAHMVHPAKEDISLLAQTGSGVCHCPSSNMILASGIAPVRAMRDEGVKVGLGVDGSASNDGNQMLGEVRQAALLQRVGWPGFESRADRMSAREALELATLGGASILQRDDIGCLMPSKAADIIAFRIDDIEHAGALSDPVAALVTCSPTKAWLSMINGRVIVDQGVLSGIDIGSLVNQHNLISQSLLRKAGLS